MRHDLSPSCKNLNKEIIELSWCSSDGTVIANRNAVFGKALVCRTAIISYLRRLDKETMRPIKHAERGLTLIAQGLFNAIQSVNKYKPNPSFTPKWSDKPLLKSWQK